MNTGVRVVRCEANPIAIRWLLTVELSNDPDDAWIDIFLSAPARKGQALKSVHPTFGQRQISCEVPAYHVGDALRFLEESIAYANQTYECTLGQRAIRGEGGASPLLLGTRDHDEV
jgi:hypothetical protein